MNWSEFKLEAPDLAALGEERFESTGLVLVGTIRKDGWPRISPVEPLLFEGRLCLGMMWRSRKALDLMRDPKCTVNSIVSNKDGTEGDFKAFGFAVEENDLEVRSRFCDALFEKIGWKPEEPEFHLFAIDIRSAAFIRFEDEKMEHILWRADDRRP
ncbi:MAG: pyridoxamine 5'-phosphate oxidase family protein [Chloroflexi bacterium]|nr:pyridoxamine 5'-phosphate oxidase family protein [Chloroflexota bacterium]